MAARKIVIYLGGPMSGYPDFNYPAFNEAAKQLRAMGFVVDNPAEHFGGDDSFDKTLYMRWDIAAILNADMVVVLPGWDDSEGAQLEVQIAHAIGTPVHELEEVIQ